jgi:hypothetical protein
MKTASQLQWTAGLLFYHHTANSVVGGLNVLGLVMCLLYHDLNFCDSFMLYIAPNVV